MIQRSDQLNALGKETDGHPLCLIIKNESCSLAVLSRLKPQNALRKSNRIMKTVHRMQADSDPDRIMESMTKRKSFLELAYSTQGASCYL
jgi:hypothetical protein